MSNIGGRLSRLKSYPYTNTRVRAMRANLITDAEYRKLEKMELSEIAEFLSNRGYGREMEELGATYSGEELIERALKRNLSNTYMKLIRISPENVQELLQAYYRKFEIQNLKTILRKKMRETSDDITETLIPTQNMDRETLQRYLEMDSVDAVLDEFTIHGLNGDLQQLLDDAADLQEMENVLDLQYYRHLYELTEQASKESTLFYRFLSLELALLNIRTVLRMKRQGYAYDDILDRLVDIPERMQIVDTKELAAADSYEDALEQVKESDAGTHIASDSPAEMSRALEKYKLEQGIEMLHIDQLSINPILGFMICKEIEVSNLRMIARAKEDDLGEDFIDRNLVRGVA